MHNSWTDLYFNHGNHGKNGKKSQYKMIGMMVVFTTCWRKSPFSLRACSQTKAALTPPTSSRGFIILNRKIH